MQREYEQSKIIKSFTAAETNKNKFWKILKRKRDSKQIESNAIKTDSGDIDE